MNVEKDQGPGSRDAQWEHFSHMADVGIRGYGTNCGQAFAAAGTALTAIVCDPGTVRPVKSFFLRCSAANLELLFVDWLNELIYLMAAQRLLFSDFEVRIHGTTLDATVRGEDLDRLRHRPAVELKAATYAELRVERDSRGRWVAQCVVDV